MKRVAGLDWRLALAIASILALAFAAVIHSRTVCSSAASVSEARQTEQECAAAKKANGGKTTKECKDLLTLTFEDPIAIYTLVLTLATILLVVVTAGLVYTSIRQGDDTKVAIKVARDSAIAANRSAKVAEDALVASNRGWLKVHIAIGNQPLMFSSNGASFSVAIAAKNVGDAPAHHVEPHAWLLVWRTEPGKDPQTEHERRCAGIAASVGGFTMFPGDEYPAVAHIGGMHLGISLTNEEVKAGLAASQNNQYIALFVGGCISYTSAAAPAKTLMTKFFYELRTFNYQLPNPAAGSIPAQNLELSIASFGHGNDAT